MGGGGWGGGAQTNHVKSVKQKIPVLMLPYNRATTALNSYTEYLLNYKIFLPSSASQIRYYTITILSFMTPRVCCDQV